jgi:hypothetical protein
MSRRVSSSAAIDENGRDNMLGLKPNRFAFRPRLPGTVQKMSLQKQEINLQREGAS